MARGVTCSVTRVCGEMLRVAARRALYGQEITRDTANLRATERARQSACAKEGANELSSGTGDLLSVHHRVGPTASLPGEAVPDPRH